MEAIQFLSAGLGIFLVFVPVMIFIRQWSVLKSQREALDVLHRQLDQRLVQIIKEQEKQTARLDRLMTTITAGGQEEYQ